MNETQEAPTSQDDATENLAATPAPARPGWMRRLYDWVLHWADTPYGTPALFLIAFMESSFFPVPPDPLLMALAVARRRRALFYGFVCTVGSVLGGLFGYWIGANLMDSAGNKIIELYGLQDHFAELSVKFGEYDFWAILIAALTPIPYKVFTIAAGTCHLALSTFIAASVAGRGIRFMAEGALIYRFGAPIQNFIDRYFNLLAIAFVVLLAAGFVVVKMVL